MPRLSRFLTIPFFLLIAGLAFAVDFKPLNLIDHAEVKGDAGQVTITLIAQRDLVFSSYRLINPDRLIFDFPNTALGQGVTLTSVAQGELQKIETERRIEPSEGWRLILFLSAQSDFSVERSTRRIDIRVRTSPTEGLLIAKAETKSNGPEDENQRLEEERRAKEEAEKARLAEEKRKAEEAERLRLAEEKQRQEEVERKRLEEERRAKEEAEKARLAEEKRKTEEAERLRLAEEKRRQEEAERKRLEEERRAKEEAEKARLAEEKRKRDEKARAEKEAANRRAEAERKKKVTVQSPPKSSEKPKSLPVRTLKAPRAPEFRMVGFHPGKDPKVTMTFDRADDVEVEYVQTDPHTIEITFSPARITNSINLLPINTEAFDTHVLSIRTTWDPSRNVVKVTITLRRECTVTVSRQNQRFEFIFKRK